MDRLEANFHSDCTGMHAQLAGLAALVRLLDPQLTAFLARREATTFFFCYRWLLIHFKREFAFDEARGPARRAACCRLGPPRRGAPRAARRGRAPEAHPAVPLTDLRRWHLSLLRWAQLERGPVTPRLTSCRGMRGRAAGAAAVGDAVGGRADAAPAHLHGGRRAGHAPPRDYGR